MNKTLIIGITIFIVLVVGGGTFWFSQSDSVKVEKILTKALTAEEQDIEAPESEEVPENGAEEYMDDKDESSATESPTPTPVKVSPTPAPVKAAPSVDKALSAAAQDDAPEAVEPDIAEDGADSYQD